MSHAKEREEKVCLNCMAELNGRFCHLCGQENLEPQESVWNILTHFFNDITHFDGKFFSTSSYLMTKPGFLSKEYMRGRRASYLNPIRMYVFSSAVFFIIFFSLFNVDKMDLRDEIDNVQDSAMKVSSQKQAALKEAKSLLDSVQIETYYEAKQPSKEKDIQVKSPAEATKGLKIESDLTETGYHSASEYDSVQKTLPRHERDGWFERKIMYRRIQLANKYKNQEYLFIRDLLNKFIHSFPYLLFVSLPLYALFLKLLYIRQKQFYYVSHGIFLIHLYIFTFLVLLLLFGLDKLQDAIGWGWISFLEGALIIYGIYYTIKAMRVFYGQRLRRTIFKFILFNIMCGFFLIILFLFFFILTVFRI